MRTRFLFKVYVAALYVAEPSNVPAQVIKAPDPERMELTLSREAGSRQWVEALRQGVEQNHSPAGMGSMRPRLAQFEKTIESLGEARLGDRMQLDFMPGVGTQIRMNGVCKTRAGRRRRIPSRAAVDLAWRRPGSG